MRKTVVGTMVAMLAGLAAGAWWVAEGRAEVVSAMTESSIPCSLFRDYMELDWITDDDPYHFGIASPHPELSNPRGEWDFRGYVWGAGETHGLKPGRTRNHHGFCIPD